MSGGQRDDQRNIHPRVFVCGMCGVGCALVASRVAHVETGGLGIPRAVRSGLIWYGK